VIDSNARMTDKAGRFAGLDRFEARQQVVAELDKLGLLEKVEPYKLSLGTCQRCKTPVEPLVSMQWWAKMKPLAEPAIRAVKDTPKKLHFVPENWEKTYLNWMENIRDWCISRQLWWGHRIPAWHCGDCKETTVARETPTVCSHCGSVNIEQDTDVLDTWFSSGLWPFSTLGWPDDTVDMRAFYPTTLLVTGFDIIFFWAARMIMLGIEMTGELPFAEVHIHGLVRDAERQKMSKTKGNTIDPLVINEKYGTDAVRFALLGSAAPGNDIALSEDRIASTRNFANKIWNASRLLFSRPREGSATPVSPADRWIGSCLNRVTEIADGAFKEHRYHEAAEALWHFWWDDFCDWYLEFKKSDADWSYAYHAYEIALKLLHPLMPFITEELWHRLGHETSIALERYPQAGDRDPAAEREMQINQNVVNDLRRIRAEYKIGRQRVLNVELYGARPSMVVEIKRLANVQLEMKDGIAQKREGWLLGSTNEPEMLVEMPAVPGLTAEQRERLEKENEQLEKVTANAKRQLDNEDIIRKMPEHVVAKLRSNLAGYEAQLAKNRAALNGE
jgi:valyl-tRNA synthetase